MGFKVWYDETNKSYIIQQKICFQLKEHVIRIRNLLSSVGVYKLEACGATGGNNSPTTELKCAY